MYLNWIGERVAFMQEENERLPRIDDTCRWDRFSLHVVEATGRGMVRIEIRELSDEESTA